MLVASTYSPLCVKDFGCYKRELWFVKFCESVSAAVSEMKLPCSNWPAQRMSHSLWATLHLHQCRRLSAFHVKRGQSAEKVYGCLYACFTSRAVHIEDVSSLETDSFTKAPRRFTFKSWLSERNMERQCEQFRRCREGNLKVPFDWNQDELNECLRKDEISCYLCPRTERKFQPPTASRMSGICLFVFF